MRLLFGLSIAALLMASSGCYGIKRTCVRSHTEQECTTYFGKNQYGGVESGTSCHDKEVCDEYEESCRAKGCYRPCAEDGECPGRQVCDGEGHCVSPEPSGDDDDAPCNNGSACKRGYYCHFENCTPPGECIPESDGCRSSTRQLYNPEIGCDGKLYKNQCEREAAGVNFKSDVDCTKNSDCGNEQYCKFSYCDPPGRCNWKASEDCRPISRFDDEPQLGCDGRVYKNSCEMESAGVNERSQCKTHSDCRNDQYYCETAGGKCAAMGRCAPRRAPGFCSWILFWGCDGKMYKSPCEARAAGVSFKSYVRCDDDSDCRYEEFRCEPSRGICEDVFPALSNWPEKSPKRSR